MRTVHFIRPIGAGAVGTVYLAEWQSAHGFSRTVAVKVLVNEGPHQDMFLSRIRDEARLLGLLHDASILQVLDMIRVEDKDAVVMEYVEGVDLESLSTARSLPLRPLVQAAADAARAIDRAHNAKHPRSGTPLGVVHRDVKPANIMVTVDGRIKLLDFGVARAHFATRESFTGQMVLGTLNYMAPEYIVTGEISPKADIYGLALAMWEVAAQAEFGAPKMREDAHNERLQARLSHIDEGYGPLVPLLARMLSWSPEERPDGELVERALRELDKALAGPGIATWARQEMPTLLAEQPPVEDAANLAGRTIQVMGASLRTEEVPKTSPPPPPLGATKTLDPSAAPVAPDLVEASAGPVAPAEDPVPPGLSTARTVILDEQQHDKHTVIERQSIPPRSSGHRRTPARASSPEAPRRRGSPVTFIVQGLFLGGALGFLVVVFVAGLLILRGSFSS